MTTPKAYDEYSLRGFGRAIMEVTEGRHLSREETKEIYRQILLAKQPGLKPLMQNKTQHPQATTSLQR